MRKNGIILISAEDVIQINKQLERKSVADKGKIDFIVAKIKSKRLSRNLKRDVANMASILWYDVISNHPFTDGNKRTATEVMKLFLKLNGFGLQGSANALVYISLKIANRDIKFNQLVKWIETRLVKMK